MIDFPATYAFDQMILHDATLRRAYLAMLAERRAAKVATAFAAAKNLEELEHARGSVAVLDELRHSFEKEQRNVAQRSNYADRTA